MYTPDALRHTVNDRTSRRTREATAERMVAHRAPARGAIAAGLLRLLRGPATPARGPVPLESVEAPA